jgi:hypothetical protein
VITPVNAPVDASEERPLPEGRRWLATGLLALVLAASAAAPAAELEVIELKAQTAERLLPILQPLMPAEAVLSGSGGHLFVRGDEATRSELRRLLDTLDRPPRRLVVQVRDAALAAREASGRMGRADVHVDGTGELRVGGTVDIVGTHQMRDTGATERVQVLEGEPARIASATALAVPLLALVPVPGGVLAAPGGVNFIEAGRETWVRARVTGNDEVIVELAASREALLPGGAGLTGTAVSTTFTGPLGAWFDVTGTRTEERRTREVARVYGTRGLGTRETSLQMRVDLFP